MPELILGPLLRYVDATSATVWVEADAPCAVTVSCHDGPEATSHTFTAHGHHYALVVLAGLAPGAAYSYTVHVGDDPVWPEPDSSFPTSRIRTIDPDRPLRLVFGSCRTSAPHDRTHMISFDTLARTVAEIARGARGAPPASVLLLSGDVHYSYLAKARIRRAASPVYQVVCSPIRNPLKRLMRVANGIASFGVAGLFGRYLARAAGVRKPPFNWRVRRGPFFHNALGTLDLAGRQSTLRLHTARITADDPPPLKQIAAARLT